jgi:hypothetical protein
MTLFICIAGLRRDTGAAAKQEEEDPTDVLERGQQR